MSTKTKTTKHWNHTNKIKQACVPLDLHREVWCSNNIHIHIRIHIIVIVIVLLIVVVIITINHHDHHEHQQQIIWTSSFNILHLSRFHPSAIPGSCWGSTSPHPLHLKGPRVSRKPQTSGEWTAKKINQVNWECWWFLISKHTQNHTKFNKYWYLTTLRTDLHLHFDWGAWDLHFFQFDSRALEKSSEWTALSLLLYSFPITILSTIPLDKDRLMHNYIIIIFFCCLSCSYLHQAPNFWNGFPCCGRILYY